VIAGGGPAGAHAAATLAGGGRRVVLFDEKLAWEKPCGGGITHKALAEWPFLREAQVERNWVRACEILGPSGRRVSFRLNQPVAIFSRRVLNGLLLERAQQAGADVVPARVLQIERRAASWHVRFLGGSVDAEYFVLAAGARNSLRKQFAPEDLMATAGYYIPGESRLMQIQFLEGLHGYIWIFPRADHLSAGICGKLGGQSTAQLRRWLEAALLKLRIDYEGAQFYSHILPSLRASTLRKAPVSGEGWAMVGDAAGFVDPITGEGLYYALKSAALMSSALLAGQPESYPTLLREDLLPELEAAARVADRFYTGSWMGRPVLEHMIQFTGSSSTFRELMSEMFAGTQGYRGLRRRLYRSLPAMLGQSLVAALLQPSSEARAEAHSAV
jgi:flavin-dependent dehydrogenase